MKKKATTPSFLFFSFTISLLLLIPATPSLAWTRPDSSKAKKPNKVDGSEDGNDNNVGGFFFPGGGFRSGWPGGYGGGFGGPGGGYSKGGIVRPTVVCKEKGPCYKKRLICPAKCFSSYSRSGKGYGGGGGGGGCTVDCKKKCVAYC